MLKRKQPASKQSLINIITGHKGLYQPLTPCFKKTSTHIIGYKLRNSCLTLIIFDTKIPHDIARQLSCPPCDVKLCYATNRVYEIRVIGISVIKCLYSFSKYKSEKRSHRHTVTDGRTRATRLFNAFGA